ncbi:uncharacterized protein [Rhodnius prolixus]|uniref:Uncharacterized protein n=1 Tax=Rhodnius prolixus TaxID=13249 RepID=T1I7P7_RHOPR
MSRRQKYLKQTDTLRAFPSRCQKGDSEVGEIDVPPDSHDKIESKHKLREVHVVLQRLHVLPERVKARDHESSLSNPKKSTLDVNSGDLGKNVHAITCESKQICTSDVAIPEIAFSTSCSTPQTLNIENNSLLDAPQETEPFLHSPLKTTSPICNNQSVPENRNKNVDFSTYETLNTNLKSQTSPCPVISQNECKKPSEDNPVSSGDKKMVVQNKCTKKKVKISSEISNASFNKELRNLLSDKLEEKYDLNFTASNVDSSEFSTRITRSSIHPVTDRPGILSSEEREIFKEKNSDCTENEEKISKKKLQISSQNIMRSKNSVEATKELGKQKSHDFFEAKMELIREDFDGSNANTKIITKEEVHDKSSFNDCCSLTSINLNEDDSSKCLTKDVSLNKLDKDSTKKKGKKEENRPSSGNGWSPQLKDPVSSQNDQSKQIIFDASSEKEDSELKQGSTDSENGESYNESTNNARFSSSMQLSSLQNEKQEQSSIGAKQESQKFELKHSENDFSEKVPNRRQTRFTSRASFEKAKSSIKFEYCPKNVSEHFGDSEPDALHNDDTEHSVKENSDNKESTFGLPGTINRVRKRKVSGQISTETFQNSLSFKSVHDSLADVITTSAVEDKYANAKIKTRKIDRGCSISKATPILAPKRCLSTSSHSCEGDSTNNDLHNRSNEDQKPLYDSSSAIVNVEKEKSVKGLSFTTTKQKKSNVSFNEANSTREKSINSKYKRFSINSESAFVEDTKNITSDTSISKTRKQTTSRRSPPSSIKSTRDINKNSSPSVDQEVSQDSSSKITNRKIVTDRSSTGKNKKRAVTTSDSNSGDLVSALLEEIPIKDKEDSNVSQSELVKEKTNKKDAALPISEVTDTHAKSSLHQEIPFEGEEINKNSDAKKVEEKEGKIVQDMPLSTTNKKPAFNKCDIINSGNLNASIKEFPNPEKELSNVSEDLVVKKITNKKKINAATSVPTQKHVMRKRVSSLPKSLLEDFPIRDQLYKYTDSKISKDKKERIVQDMAPATMNKNQAFNTTDSFNGSLLLSISKEGIPNKSKALSKTSDTAGVKRKTITKDADISKSKQIQKLDLRKRVCSLRKCSSEEIPCGNQEFSLDFDSKITKDRKEINVQEIAPSVINQKLSFIPCNNNHGNILSVSTADEDEAVKRKTNNKKLDTLTSLPTHKHALRTRLSSSPKYVLEDIPIEDKIFSKDFDSNVVQQEKIIQDMAQSSINNKLPLPQSDDLNGNPLSAVVRGISNKDTTLSYHSEALVNKEKLNKKDIDMWTPKRFLRKQSTSPKSSLNGNPTEDQGFSKDSCSKIPKEITIPDVATSSINEKLFLNTSASIDSSQLSVSREEIPNKDKALSNDSERLVVKGKSNRKGIDVSVSKHALRKRLSSSFKSSLEDIPIADPEISKDSAFNKDLTEKKLTITTSDAFNSDPLSASMGSILNKDKILSNISGDVTVKEKTSDKDTDVTIHKTRQNLVSRKRGSSSLKSSFQEIPIEDLDFSKDSDSRKTKEKKENVTDRSASIALNQKPTLSAADSFDSSHLSVSVEKIPNKNKTSSNSSIAVNLRKRDTRRRVSTSAKHTNFNEYHSMENTLSKDQAILKDFGSKNEMKKTEENAKELLSMTEQNTFTSSDKCRISEISSTVAEVPKKCQNPSNYSECEDVREMKNEIDTDTMSTVTRANLASSKRVYSPNKCSRYMDIISSSQEVQNKDLMRSKHIPVAIVKRRKKKIVISSKSLPLAKRNYPSSQTELDNDVSTNEDIINKYSEHKSDSESTIVSGIKIIDKNISKPTTRQKSHSKRGVSNFSNDLVINNSLEEIHPKTQEIISETTASAFVKRKKRKIDIFSSSTTKQNFATENKICISSQSTDNGKIKSEKQELLMDSETSTPTTGNKRMNTLSAKKSSRNLIDIDVIKDNATNVVKNKKACINKNSNLKIKLLKKRKKKIKSRHTFRRKIASKWKGRSFGKTEWSKTTKLPEFQLEKQTLVGNCNSDKALVENLQNVSLPLISSTDINVRNKIIESKTQTSIETLSKVTSDDHNSLKEEITSTNLPHVTDRGDSSNFCGDSSETFSSSNNLKAIDSVPSTSDFQREHPGRKYDSLKGSITNLKKPKGQSSDHQISPQVLNVDLFCESATDTSPDAAQKEIPTKIINQESSKQEQTESSRNLETINVSGNSTTSRNISSVDCILKEVQDVLSEVVRQVEIESNTHKSFRAEAVEEPFKVDLSLTVLNALKSAKLAMLPSHKAKMATYLLKQLIINHPPKKQSNELNKLEKAKSEPTLYIPFDLFAEEKKYKKGNEHLYNKPENVQKVSSSTSTKENSEEHTFKIPIKAAPKAKKKSVCTKSGTFLKPKANECTVFLPQKVSSNMRGKMKLYSPGTIQRKLISEPLLNSPSNRNGKKIDISGQFQAVQKPSVSKTYLKHMPELRQVNKTLLTERRSTLQLRNVSPLHNTNKSSQVYNPRDIARTGTDINAAAPDANALYLSSAIKKQNNVENGKQNNENFLKHNLLVCNEACDRKKTSHADKGITGSDVNKIESQTMTSITTDNCSKQNDIRPSESSSSSDVVSTLINSNSDKKIADNFSKIQNESISCINKDIVTLKNQITDSSNFTMISPTKLKGSSYKSVEPRSSTEDINKSEDIVSEKIIGQVNFVVKSKSSKTTSAETSHLKQPNTSQRTDKDIYSGLSSQSNVHPNSKDLTKQNKNFVLKMTKKSVNSCSNEHAIKQKHAPEHKFQNEISKEPTVGKCTSNLKSSSESKTDKTSKEISSSKISIPFKDNSEKFTNASLKNKNSTSEIQRVPTPGKLPLKENLTTESSSLAQDTSSKKSKLAAQVCELISDLRNLDETTAVALKNYNNSIKNEEISKELKGMMLREGLTPKTLPDRPPEWFLKFIANFRKQELWRLHQMFKIHDHLMRIESAKLNVLEKVFEELKEKEGIRDD